MMHFVYPDRYSFHWSMLADAIRSNYYQDNSVVIMGKYLHENIEQYRSEYPGCKIIVYQLEPLSVHNAWWKADIITQFLHQADEVWDYDISNIEYLREKCGIHAYFRPFLYSDTCCNYVDHNRHKDLEVLFYGYYTPHRSNFLSILTDRWGGSFAWITHISHPLLDDYISRAKVVINLHHADNLTQQEQTRMFYLLSNGKTIISEKSRYNVYGDLITEVDGPYEMAEALYQMLPHYDVMDEINRKEKFKLLTYNDVLSKFVDEND